MGWPRRYPGKSGTGKAEISVGGRCPGSLYRSKTAWLVSGRKLCVLIRRPRFVPSDGDRLILAFHLVAFVVEG